MPRPESPAVRHALTDAAFAALGAGRPDPDTIAELRKAQLSRTLLLLRAIIQAAPTTTTLWYGELTAADHTNPSGTRRLLADPLCGVWAADCLTALRNGTPPEAAGLTRLRNLATTATNLSTASTHSTGDAASARMLVAEQDGLTIRVRLEDVDPLRSRLGLTPTGRLTDAEFAHWQRCLTQAWHVLVTRHRPAAEVLAGVLQVIVPVEPDPAAGGISATSAHAFGAVAMSAPSDGTALAVGLLHETQHSILNAVQYLFDLHFDPNTLGYSPWRDDPRPASGTLHGAYAYLAVTRFWRTELTAGAQTPLTAGAQTPLTAGAQTRLTADERTRLTAGAQTEATAGGLAEFEFARWRAAVATVAGDILAAGALTHAGDRFVGALHAEVTPWLDEPVTPDIARLATGANADHYLRWRLRNLVVDRAATAAFADAWRQGQAPPRHELTTHLRPAPRRALENSTRLALIHHHLRTQPPTPPPSRADFGPAPHPNPPPPPAPAPAAPTDAATTPTPSGGDFGSAPHPESTQPRADITAATEEARATPSGGDFGSAAHPEFTRPGGVMAATNEDARAVPSRGGSRLTPHPETTQPDVAITAPGDEAGATPSGGDFGMEQGPNSPRGRVGVHGEGGGSGAVSGQLARRRAAAGDAAYLRGDYGTAGRAYQEALEFDPGDDAAWTGLALVSGVPGLRDRPEVVAAIYRVLAGPDGGKTDPFALAWWVFG